MRSTLGTHAEQCFNRGMRAWPYLLWSLCKDSLLGVVAGQAGHGNGREALGAQSLGLYCGEEYTGDQAGGLALLAAEQGLGAGPGWHLHCWV